MQSQQSNSTTARQRPVKRSSLFAQLRRLQRDDTGSTAVEFAIVAMPFMILMFLIIELGIVFFAGQVLDNAVTDSARLIRTGQAIEAGFDEAAFKQEVLDGLPAFFAAERLNVDVKSYTSFAAVSIPPAINEDGTFNDESEFSPGGASDIVVVRVLYRWPMAGSYLGVNFADVGGDRVLGSVAAFRNEPFPF